MTERLSRMLPDANQSNQGHLLDSIPEDLESSGAKLVYLAVKVSEEPTASELATKLQMKSLTLYPILRTLSERGYVDADGDIISCA